MMKREYSKPTIHVHELRRRPQLLQASPPRTLSTPDDTDDWYELG